MKKKLLYASLVCATFLLSNNLFSQSNNWEEYLINDIYKIEYSYQTCEFSSTASQELVVFKISNLINNNINLNYSTKIWNNGKEVETELNPEEFRRSIKLQANEVFISDCETNNKEYTIFSGFVHNTTQERYPTLTKFELINITIENE
ncbi:MAG: hypothetical protein CMD22_04395 [Flavobacteriales bacterium]|nr:hypothetical protein [Flavobacteriales bacterium]|tara:strand:+ start:616 stop:1059 length:444 start_codon:yes stop_codon:yes gene_type:complete